MPDKLYVYPDGSYLTELKASDLRKYEIWMGEREISKEHITILKNSIGGNIMLLNRDYKLVIIRNPETGRRECQIIDGQHRIEILKEYPKFDFPLTATVYDYSDKTFNDVDILFKEINRAKPFEIDDDYDINKIGGAVVMHFNKGLSQKDALIRQVRTRAPYMSVDVILEWLSELVKKCDGVVNDRLVVRVLVEINESMLKKISDSDKPHHARCKEIGFALTLTNPEDWTKSYIRLIHKSPAK